MGGAVAHCARSACCCDAEGAWEADATTFGLEELKKRLEGQRKQARTNPTTEPDVYFTFLEVDRRDGGSIRFSPQRFVLRDLLFKVEVEIVGSKSVLVQKAAAKGADVALGKIGVGEDKKSTVTEKIARASAKISSASDKVKEKIGLPSSGSSSSRAGEDGEARERTRKVVVDITVDLLKDFSQEEVGVQVKDLRVDHALLQKLLSIDALRRLIERAISEKASEIATKLGREKLKEHMPTAASVLGY